MGKQWARVRHQTEKRNMADKTANQDEKNLDPTGDTSGDVQPGLDGLLGDEEATGPSVGSVGREALRKGNEDAKTDNE